MENNWEHRVLICIWQLKIGQQDQFHYLFIYCNFIEGGAAKQGSNRVLPLPRCNWLIELTIFALKYLCTALIK